MSQLQRLALVLGIGVASVVGPYASGIVQGATGLVQAAPGSTQAAPPARRHHIYTPHPRPQNHAARGRGKPWPSHGVSARYPQYTDGFHARYFQEIGVPAGDVGLRGNGFSLAPW